MAGGTGDQDAYARNHVIARLRRTAIRGQGLANMLECGDNDCFNLHDGPPAAAVRAWLDAGATSPMSAVDHDSAEGPEVLRLLLEPEIQAASARDPGMARRYGIVATGPGRS